MRPIEYVAPFTYKYKEFAVTYHFICPACGKNIRKSGGYHKSSNWPPGISVFNPTICGTCRVPIKKVVGPDGTKWEVDPGVMSYESAKAVVKKVADECGCIVPKNAVGKRPDGRRTLKVYSFKVRKRTLAEILDKLAWTSLRLRENRSQWLKARSKEYTQDYDRIPDLASEGLREPTVMIDKLKELVHDDLKWETIKELPNSGNLYAYQKLDGVDPILDNFINSDVSDSFVNPWDAYDVTKLFGVTVVFPLCCSTSITQLPKSPRPGKAIASRQTGSDPESDPDPV
jgi:hypothetical protein